MKCEKKDEYSGVLEKCKILSKNPGRQNICRNSEIDLVNVDVKIIYLKLRNEFSFE